MVGHDCVDKVAFNRIRLRWDRIIRRQNRRSGKALTLLNWAESRPSWFFIRLPISDAARGRASVDSVWFQPSRVRSVEPAHANSPPRRPWAGRFGGRVLLRRPSRQAAYGRINPPLARNRRMLARSSIRYKLNAIPRALSGTGRCGRGGAPSGTKRRGGCLSSPPTLGPRKRASGPRFLSTEEISDRVADARRRSARPRTRLSLWQTTTRLTRLARFRLDQNINLATDIAAKDEGGGGGWSELRPQPLRWPAQASAAYRESVARPGRATRGHGRLSGDAIAGRPQNRRERPRIGPVPAANGLREAN